MFLFYIYIKRKEKKRKKEKEKKKRILKKYYKIIYKNEKYFNKNI